MPVIDLHVVILSFASLILIALAGAAAYFIKLIFDQLRDLSSRIESLSSQISSLEIGIVRAAINQDQTISESVRKMQADVKSLEFQLRDTGHVRENPEIVDTAIRMAREGMSSDKIVAKTGMDTATVESIILFHGKSSR
ncbi:MAG: hypothetical protein RL543_734 [Pseudomonadota bacterium]|jgi:hypothetical protein